jgi:L-2-hydroxyglutarate oxidase LhgO
VTEAVAGVRRVTVVGAGTISASVAPALPMLGPLLSIPLP